jgi:predicted regulator of Ras-like GTPase activity (Roadblock/LC7/MglB family)
MMHTGKTKGTFSEVLPKVKTLRGAMRVITPEGRGVVLVDMGRPVASYLKSGETTLRGREALAILASEPMTEYDLVAYDDGEFSEAMGICASEGLRLEDARGDPGAQIGAAVTAGVQKGGGLLSQFLRRFTGGEKEAETVPSAPSPSQQAGEGEIPEPARAVAKVPEPVPVWAERPQPAEAGEGGDIPPAGVSPPPATAPEATAPEESELSAIVKRLSRSRKEESPFEASVPPAGAPPGPPAAAEPGLSPGAQSPSPGKEEGPPVSPAPLTGIPALQDETAAGRPGDDTLEEILKRYKSGRTAQVLEAQRKDVASAPAKAPGEREEQARVELNAMMKRITRLDIVSFKKEMADVKTAALRNDAKGQLPVDLPKETAAGEPVPVPPVTEADTVLPDVSSREPTRPSSDIDDLKAFIRRLEGLEMGAPESVPEGGAVAPVEPPRPAGEPPLPSPKEIPGIIFHPGVLTGETPRPKEVTAVPPGDASRKAVSPRFGEPLEADRKVERRPVVLSEAPAGAEKPSRDVIIHWKKDEPLSGAAAGTVTRPDGVRAETPRRRPVILKREIDIRRVERRPERPRPALPLLDDKKIDKIMRQPGVLAVSVFQEGFAVQSVGQADFDQVAANAEDLLRVGTKIASDIRIGSLHQIILESEGGKLIISPYGDLNLCVFTDADANLGLIRVAIRSLQTE